ncbi:MAG: DUF3078 domain-containing protein [Candidatus Zixiibacteriota bacterium]
MKSTVSTWSTLILSGLFLCAAPTLAEDQKRILEPGHWYPTIETGATLTQSTFSDNWKGGDKGSVVWTAILNAGLENQIRPSLHWNNTLKLAYGQTHQQKADSEGRRFWQRPEKSTDLVDFETIMRLTRGWVVDPFVSGRFESQFQDASDPAGRNLSLNPKKFSESAGLARQFFDTEERSLLSRLGFTLRQTSRKLFVNDAPDKSTVSKSTNDGGIESVTEYKAKILTKRVTWSSKLILYKPLYYSGKDNIDGISADDLTALDVDPNVADYTLAIDADWENIFTTQITKLLSVNLYLRWLYDKYDNSVPPQVNDSGELTNPGDVQAAIRKAGQFKQTLSLGITYRLL